MMRKIFFLSTIIFLTACSPTVETTIAITPTLPEKVEPTQVPSISQSNVDEQDAQFESEDAATELMYLLLLSSGIELDETVNTIIDSGDQRFSAVFLELLRASQIGVYRNIGYSEIISVLENISGQSFGGDWTSWVEWYGGTELTPPPGFIGWKGQLLSAIDPGFGVFLQNDYPSTIRTEEIMWGGVMVDGIPALDHAEMIQAADAEYLEPGEPVFGISINSDHRAYPLRILDWHEMANDTVGGVPVSIAYCTLCGAGIAFDGRASNGETYNFGSSGFLYRSNKLMYDRNTNSLWNQLTGEPVLGPLVDSNIKLNLLPIVVTTWESWLEQHPETLVLDIDTGYQRPYFPGAAYGDYFASQDTMFPVWQRSDLLETKDRIYALQIEGIPKAYPIELLSEEQVVNDTIGNTALVLIANRGKIFVDGENQRVGPVIYKAGGEVRAYNRQEETYSPGPDADTVLDSTGRTWQITEEALIGPDGKMAPRVNGHLAYWFGWYTFFPNTLIYEATE
ncbi:MAG: DUF3179 domain-containing protein [Anaerolineales bacterium]|nr:DUF3179 domain-containing protein [Chloroflexota bacterium]MBL6982018.1 DUF3179 domain-containing protein [Anaerolineales bacterium]